MAALPGGTVTFLFTDVEGSTRLLNQLGPDYAEILAEHHRILRAAFAAHGGREVDNQGDSFFVAFPAAKDAVAAAVDAQRDLFAHPWPAGAEVKVRMGLHTGEPRRGDDRYVGIGVHRAARIGAAGHGGQVLLSSTTKELAEEDLPAGVTIRDLGERRLKDMERSERLYQLVIEGLPGEFGPLNTLDVELQRKRRRMYAGAALIGVLAAAVAVPVFAFGQGGSGGSTTVDGNAVAIIDPASNRVTGQVPVGVAPSAHRRRWDQRLGREHRRQDRLAHRRRRRQGRRQRPGRGRPDECRRRAERRLGRSPIARRLPRIVKVDPRYGLAGKRLVVQGDANGDAAVAVAREGVVWVISEGGLLERLDSAGSHVTARIDTGNSPSSIAVGADGVWAADGQGNNVARIDPATKAVAAAIPVGNAPNAVAAGAGAVWVVDEADSAVVRIDPASNSGTSTIPVGRSPTGIAVGLGSVWVTNSRDGTVSRIDPVFPYRVQTITVGGSPQAVAVGGGRVWVSVQNALVGPGKQAGGVAHITFGSTLDSLDPALAYTLWTWEIEYATCAKLVNYADSPAPAGSRLEPEVATALPVPTNGGKTYTFTIRPGFRFSPPSNAPVTAQSFKFAIERSLGPKTKGPRTGYLGDVVGAQAYMAGKANHISGVIARRNTLTVRLTRADPVILSQLSTPFFCAVPPGTPVEAFPGVSTVPSAGPYYISSYNPAQGTVLKRNPNYHGARPHTLDEIDFRVNVGPAESVREIEAGTADFSAGGVPADQVASLAARYGPGSAAARARGQRYFVNPQIGLWYLALNTSRPLFRDANLRRAVNYALDRRAIARLEGGPPGVNVNTPTAQYLPPGVPGYRDTHVYPLTPDLTRARQLARGHGGKAVLYYLASPSLTRVAQAIQSELAQIGINVEIKALSFNSFFNRAGTRGEPYDMALSGWNADYPDPSNFLNTLYEGSAIRAKGGANFSFFNDPVYNRKFAAAARLSGPRRYLAYQALEADLARNGAPAAPLWNGNEADFFSARIGSGCKVYQPVYGVDLAALCLKRHR